jgi:RNA polymerase sigma-70 factor (ECF subfamily)
MNDARAIAEETARASYGCLIAYLSARTRDIAACEDALGEAFAAALTHWPQSGIPAAPEAWLLTAARRKIIDGARRAKTQHDAERDILILIDEVEAMTREDKFVDERLKLLFICAHPAIDPAIRTPLMLQTVLGLDAARIASAFLISPVTMSQRLVRAKRKISSAGIPFETPALGDLGDRAAAVLDAIYAAFSAGYDAGDSADASGADLSREALFLARLAASLLPENAEAQGLLALILYIDARQAARRCGGAYVPLERQSAALFDLLQIDEGDTALGRAASLRNPGRYQLEAAIQSAHLSGKLSGDDTSGAIINLYARLLAIAPSVGAEIGRAAALIKAGRAGEALTALDAVDTARIETHQPYWAARGHALAAAGNREDAQRAFERAIGLSADAATRDYLNARLRDLG